jgi:hypothetical protein
MINKLRNKTLLLAFVHILHNFVVFALGSKYVVSDLICSFYFTPLNLLLSYFNACITAFWVMLKDLFFQK